MTAIGEGLGSETRAVPCAEGKAGTRWLSSLVPPQHLSGCELLETSNLQNGPLKSFMNSVVDYMIKKCNENKHFLSLKTIIRL